MSDILSNADACRAVLECAADAILILQDETIVGCNRKAEELFGCKREQILGRTPYSFSPPRQPDELDSREKTRHKIEAALEGQPQRFEWLHTRSDGSSFDAEVSLTRVDVGGAPLLVAVVRDITERKRLEDAVHNIAAGISAATGQIYLNLLVHYIARALGACCAFVGELLSEDQIRIVAIVRDGALAPGFDYHLAGTPCQTIVGRDLYIYPRDVRQRFPNDPFVAELEAESYIGVPLFDSNRQPIGLLSALKRTPIDNADFAEYIMRIFAARTSGELERKTSIHKLLEEKQLTEAIVNSVPGIFYMIDRQGRIVWRNRLLAAITGRRYGEHGVADPRDWIVEEDHQKYEQALSEVFETGESSVEIRVRSVEGEIRVYQCIGARISRDGAPYAVGAGIDVTDNRQMQDALRRSERDFRMIFENAPIGIYRSTPDGRFVKMNKTGAEMFGYDSPEEMIASVTNIGEQLFAHKEWRTEFLQKVLASEGFHKMENEYRRKDGTTFIGDLYMCAIREHGEVQFLDGFVEDITDRRQAEQDKQLFYRETILSVTDGKLVICDREELDPYFDNALITAEIRTAEDLAKIRKMIREFCLEHGLSGERLETFIPGVGEAATNVLRHADGGSASAGVIGEAVWAGISDHGPGIEHLTLPRAVLLRGFSTKLSLGIGYAVMLDVTDRLFLATGKGGTTVVLIKELNEPPPRSFLERLPYDLIEGHI